MQPDAIIKCIKEYRGKTAQGRSIDIKENDVFLRTTSDNLIFLNYYDEPAVQLPWLTIEEFETLLGEYLENSADL